MAYLQLNDPDPIYWVSVYSIVALIPASRGVSYRHATMTSFAFGMVIAGLLMSASGFIQYLLSADYSLIGGRMTIGRPYIEAAREFLGLCLATVCLVFYRK
jgi:hypothetical protein